MKTMEQKKKELATIALASDLLLSEKKDMNPNVIKNMDNMTDEGPVNDKLVADLAGFREVVAKEEVTEGMVFAYLVSLFHIYGMVMETEGIEDIIIRDYYGEVN